MNDPQHDLKVWLSSKLVEHGSAKRLAEALNVSSDAITRMKNLDGTKEHRTIRPQEIEGMARHFQELPPGYEGMSQWLKPKRPLISSFDDSEAALDEQDPDWDGEGAGYVDGQIRFNRSIPGSSPEFSAKSGLGFGQIDDRTARVVSNGIATGHPVVNEWLIPSNYLHNVLDASPSQVIILPVVGHSMEPILQSNDRVLVDVSQNTWMGDAVYIIDDGDGIFQAKTLRKVMSSNPPQYRIVSEAAPDEAPVIRRYDEFRIVGRVVGRFTRM